MPLSNKHRDLRCFAEHQIKVQLPGESLELLGSAYADVCFQDGCRNPDYSRADDCLPARSQSLSPSRTDTPAESPIAKQSAVFTFSHFFEQTQPAAP
jgi:hypothetical protein